MSELLISGGTLVRMDPQRSVGAADLLVSGWGDMSTIIATGLPGDIGQPPREICSLRGPAPWLRMAAPRPDSEGLVMK